MAHNTQPKPSLAKRSRSKALGRTVAMMTVEGDPVAFLQGFELPAGTKIAIVSKNSELVRKIQRASTTRFGTVREVAARHVHKVRTPVVNSDAFKPDARSQALLDGVRIAQEDLHQAGGAYDLEQVRTLMRGVSRQAIDKRVQEGSLLAVPGPSNRRSYPTLQFTRNGAVVAGLKTVRDALPTSNPWTVLNFLAQPDDRLDGRRPIDVLKEGNIDLVVDAARRMGTQGA